MAPTALTLLVLVLALLLLILLIFLFLFLLLLILLLLLLLLLPLLPPLLLTAWAEPDGARRSPTGPDERRALLGPTDPRWTQIDRPGGRALHFSSHRPLPFWKGKNHTKY